jgi:para-aminobenzoate synthetase / 4-amino-4-deoxychorismate lyase
MPDPPRSNEPEPSVVRVPLPWTLAPEQATLLVRDDARPFALIGRWAGGGALIGSEPIRVASGEDDPFALLDAMAPLSESSGAVGGGWFGWLGYQLGRRLEPVDPGPGPGHPDPGFRLAYYDHLLRLDGDGRWWFEALWTERRASALRARLHSFEERATHPPQPRPFATQPWRATPSRAGHALAVAACRERIHAGDLFQANICARLDSRLSGAPIDLFAVGVSRLRPDRAAFMSDPSGAVASLSPELFLERHGRRVRSAPIKGTRPRPADVRLAARERIELQSSEKDRAENVMIVDLVRNDLGRVCVPGSIGVDTLAEARAHTGVWHLVSEVSGVVREGIRDGALVRAAFPPGSVSGAPKVAAMNVIAELESTARELYTGAIGFASPLAGLELSVAIRTFEFRGEHALLGVGGGIVADSEPLAEAAECATKAAPLLAAIDATLAPDRRDTFSPEAAPPPPRRLGPRPVPRPSSAAGVFETLLILDGRPIDLDRHLDRLRSSARVLYDTPLPRHLGQELADAAQGHEHARMRVNLRPESQGVRADVEVAAPPERRGQTMLRPVTLPGGLGCHKWIDRGLLAALAAGIEAEPLLCDLDGLVLEAARANVFVVEDGARVVTPPLDGRILPGVTRARVLELARELGLEVAIEPVDLARLSRADGIFVTGSLGGVEPAQLDRRAGERPQADGSGDHEDAITAELARAWRSWAGLEVGTQTVHAGAERLPA